MPNLHGSEPTDKSRAMNFGDFKDGKAQQPLPPSLAPHEEEINGFANICNKTCTRILTLLALGLEVRKCPPKRRRQTCLYATVDILTSPRLKKTSSQLATTPAWAQRVVSCGIYITHQSSPQKQQPISMTRTFEQEPTPTTGA